MSCGMALACPVYEGGSNGTGVVGLAVAKALAESGRKVVILEAAGAIGTETSSRNSEVVHAGEHRAPALLCL